MTDQLFIRSCIKWIDPSEKMASFIFWRVVVEPFRTMENLAMSELNVTPPPPPRLTRRSSSRIQLQSSTKKAAPVQTVSAKKTPSSKRKPQQTPRRVEDESPTKKQQVSLSFQCIKADKINKAAFDLFGGTEDVIQRVR